MGLRGPGARPKPKPASSPHVAIPPAPPWVMPGLSRVERIVTFLESLPITSGMLAGQRMRVRDWQRRDIIEPIYGEMDDAGRRLIRLFLATMPRKNGKTGLVAGICLAHFLGPECEQRGQVYSAAADKAQAALMFAEMVAIIEAVPWMADRCNIKRHDKTIEDLETGSIYKALSAEVRSKHGFNASFVVYDELAQAMDGQLFDVLKTSMGARAEPLMLVISTQADNDAHIMSELVDHGRAVLDGAVKDPSFGACIYAAPDDADIWDEAVWFACNPALGDFRDLQEMRDSARQAKAMPSRENTFKNLYLNQRISAETRWMAPADWKACARSIDRARLAGKRCWGGLDLAATIDLAAFVLYFPEDGGTLLTWSWCPQESIRERSHNDRVPYETWVKAGHLRATPGRSIDEAFIAADLAKIAGEFDIQHIAFDRYRIEPLKKRIDELGITLPLVEFGQGYVSMAPAVDALEVGILAQSITYDGSPVLGWCVSNVVIDVDPAGNRKPTKRRARDRIDAAVAAIMAVGCHGKHPAAPRFVLRDNYYA